MRLALGLAGAGLVVLVTAVALVFGVGSGMSVSLRHDPQPRTQLTVRVDTGVVPQMLVRTLFATVRDGIRQPRAGFAAIAPSGDSVEVTIAEGVDRAQVIARLRALSRQPGATGGADTERFTVTDAGGTVLRLTPTPAAIAEGVVRALDQTIDVLTRRLDSLGLKPTLTREGDDRIMIAVPRQESATRLKGVIVTPGRLAFRFIDLSIPVDEAKAGRLPPGSEILQGRNGMAYLVEKRIAVSGESLTDAQPSFDQRTNEPIVNFRFNAAGTRQFARITQEKVGSPFAIVLDGVVLAAPVIREPILGGSGQISGAFTPESANDLAILLRAGALPAPLAIIEERTLEP